MTNSHQKGMLRIEHKGFLGKNKGNSKKLAKNFAHIFSAGSFFSFLLHVSAVITLIVCVGMSFERSATYQHKQATLSPPKHRVKTKKKTWPKICEQIFLVSFFEL
jgi:hypothetical protein